MKSFAHPFAFPQEDASFVTRLTAQLSQCRYETCATTVIGRVRPGQTFYLKRLPVNGCDDRVFLGAKVNGAYDWLALPQRVVREGRRYFAR